MPTDESCPGCPAGGGAGVAAGRCAGDDHGRAAGLAPVGGAAAARAGRHQPVRRTAGQDAAEDTAWLLDRAATYLQVHARLADARPLAERALAITEAALGPDHPDVATRLNNLALILRDLGLAGEARPLAERALAITEAAPGPGPPRRRHRPEQPGPDPAGPGAGRGGAAAGRAGAGHHRGGTGPGPPRRRHRLNNLAMILQDLGLAGEARPLAERALAIDEAAWARTTPTSPSA